MKIIDGHYWLKPFGSHISCINSIYGECPKNIDTLQDCVKICEKDPGCNAGYFVEDENNKQKYCVPLYTALWGNNNVYDNLIDSKNPTLLSSDKGIKSTVFVNEKRFPEILPPDFQDYLFLGDKVYLLAHVDNKTLYMTKNFTVSENKKEAIDLTLGFTSILGWIGEKYRIGKGNNISLYLQDTFLIMLVSIPDYKKFFWSPYKSNTVGFNFFVTSERERYTFVNNGDKFQLYKDEGGIFYFLNVYNNVLTTTPNRPNIYFSFEKIMDDPVSIYRNITYKDNRRSRGLLYKTMNGFVESYPPTISSTDSKTSRIILIIFYVAIILICIFSITIAIKLIIIR